MRTCRSPRLFVLALLAVATACPEPARAVKADKEDLTDVALEVLALQTLDQLQLTPAQLADLAKRSASTSEEAHVRPVPKVSDKYRKALTDLLAALRANNEERIDELTSALDELREKEKPDLDDDVDISEEARKQAPQVLRGLSPRQVAGFILDYADEFPDPREKLRTAFEGVRKLPGATWQAARDQTAEQVGWLVAGVEPEAEKAVRDKAADLLTRVHRLSPEDFKAQQAKLEKEIEGIVGKVGPTDVLRHFMERSLAELLSNPRLAAAIKARQKSAK